MRISVFGLGYVGAVSAACLARDGHQVVGVDPNETKVDLINSGRSPIIENGLEELIGSAVTDGRLKAVADARTAISEADLSLVCVGTPSETNGSLNLHFVRAVCDEIGRCLRDNREGTTIHDYDNPPKTVIGMMDERSDAVLTELYAALPAPLIRTAVETAEMVKYVDNVWHALKVAFANEIGSICKRVNIDSHAVMDIFCQDRKLNISSHYLKPGFAFGGSCLPKDVSALAYESARLDLDLPVLEAIMESNRLHIERALDMVMRHGRKRIGVLGLSFKTGTDDLRHSPMVEVTERLIGKGYDVRIYDRNVSLSRLIGANREYILGHIPHIARLMVDAADEIVKFAEVVIVGNGGGEFAAIVQRLAPDQHVIDLVRLKTPPASPRYEGIAW